MRFSALTFILDLLSVTFFEVGSPQYGIRAPEERSSDLALVGFGTPRKYLPEEAFGDS